MSIRKDILVSLAPHVIAFVLLVVIDATIARYLTAGWSIVVTSATVAWLVYVVNVLDRNSIILSDDGKRVTYRRPDRKTSVQERLPLDSRIARLLIGVFGMLFGIGFSIPFVRWIDSTASLIALVMTFVGSNAAAIVYDRELARRYLRRGLLSQQAGYFENSLNDFSECIQLSLRHRFEATIARGYSWLKLGDFDRARESFTFAMSQRPDSPIVEEAFYDASKVEFLEHMGEHENPQASWEQQQGFTLDPAPLERSAW